MLTQLAVLHNLVSKLMYFTSKRAKRASRLIAKTVTYQATSVSRDNAELQGRIIGWQNTRKITDLQPEDAVRVAYVAYSSFTILCLIDTLLPIRYGILLIPFLSSHLWLE